MSDQVVPSWEGVRENWWARVRRVDQKLVIAVLIGLVSVTGAVITWRSSKLGENATDKDRLAVAETVQQEQSNANVEAQVVSEQQEFSQYKQDYVDANDLDKEATALDQAGFTTQGQLASDQASALREVADTLASLTFSTDYVQFDPQSGLPQSFLVDKRRADLRREDTAAVQVDPSVTVQQAVTLRNRSQRLEGWTILLVVAVVLLTIATITRRARARPWIALVAMVIYVAATLIALVGD